jgi:steroid 5-alpha reductase family enzyme
MLNLLLQGWGIAASLQLVLWLVAQRTKNAAIVDPGWAFSFALIAGWFALRSPLPAAGWLPSLIVTVAWSLRLAGYLVSRGAATGPEEGRYVELRRKWSPNAARNFLVFFQAQALLAAVLALAFVIPYVELPVRPGLLYAGAAVSALAVIGEATADLQLARFKREHTGKVCDVGLWSWSRHPNYFFEWCVWIGHAITALAFPLPLGLLALIPQAIVLASIFGVTGIPPTEAQAVRSKGNAYRDYQKRVSRFVPMPPKRA